MSIYSTSTRGQCTPYINDLVKFVKLNIREPEVQPFMCKKVWMRNSNHLVEERKNHLWKKHYYRRQNNLSRGYHSVPWEPFQTMGGELVIDTGQLLMQTLSHVLGNKELRKHSHLYMDNQDILPPVENPPHESMSSESVEASKFSRAGFEDIMEALQITRARIAAVRAGFPYEEHVRLIELRFLLELYGWEEFYAEPDKPVNMCGSGDDQQDNDMELLSLTDLGLLAMQSRHTGESDNDMDQESGDRSSPGKPFLTSSPHETDHKSPTGVQSGDGEDIVPTSSICSSELESGSHDNKMIHVGSLLREMQERRCRDHIEYLNAIYSVILSLRRMQTRDLRSKTPLSRENLRELMKASSGTERDSRLGQVRFSRNYNRHMSMDTSLSGDTSSMSQDGGRLSILGPGVMTQRRSRVGSVMGQLAGANSRRKSRMWERDYLRVDTWDELMSLDEKDCQWWIPCSHDTEYNPQNTQMVTENDPLCKLTALRNERRSDNPSGSRWQWRKTLISFQRATGKQSKVEDNAMMVQRVKHNLGKLKHNLQMESGAELQRLERTKMVSFKFKMQCFDDMQPRSLFENHCERMQNSVQLICANPDVEIQPSRWYDELRERTQMKIAENDPDINEALSKIGRFSQFGAKTVLYAKAKLCLLVMSLPAFEVCKISMQAALKFVMEKILVGQEEVLHHWLNQRRLPWVLAR